MKNQSESVSATWIFIGALIACFLLFSTFSYFFVGNRGQPDWAFRPVADVPGQSPYAIYTPLPFPQHVQGEEGE
jgi:hypothetical protein